METNTTTKQQLRPGDILASSWGYDQTNWDFYRVNRATENTVWLVKLQAVQKESPTLFMQGEIVPTMDTEGKEFRRKISRYDDNGDVTVKIFSFSYAHKWDGRPKHYTAYA
jgi:hypothetical protein